MNPTPRRRSAQPPGGDLEPINIPATALIVHAARESFDAPTLRYLSREFTRLADEKEAGE